MLTKQSFGLCSYMEKHQVQLFGRGHIGGIDIKVNSEHLRQTWMSLCYIGDT